MLMVYWLTLTSTEVDAIPSVSESELKLRDLQRQEMLNLQMTDWMAQF